MSAPEASQSASKSVSIFWILAGSLSGWPPLVVHSQYFWKFFYFMDEWALIDQMESLGYYTWVFGFFAENFVPVFKLLWSGLIFAGGGNYHLLLIAGFANHMVILFLMGYLLRMWGLGLFPILFSQLVVGLNYTHIEVLSWSSQWTALLAFTSFLLVLIPFSQAYLEKKVISWWMCGVIALVSSAGALSFSRGVLNGVVLVATCVVLWLLRDPRVKYTWRPAFFAMAPCVVIALIIAIWSYTHSANFSNSGSRLGIIVSHFLYRISLNPWYQQIRGLQISVSLSILLLQLNLLAAGLGIYWAKPRFRPLLYVLILFFLGDAALLALGRNHLPVDTVPAWRYQYFTLVVFAPFVGLVVEKLIQFMPFQYVRMACYAVALLWTSQWVFKPWKHHLPTWSEHRGTITRELLVAEDLDLKDHTISRYHKVTNERSVELKEKYNLH